MFIVNDKIHSIKKCCEMSSVIICGSCWLVGCIYNLDCLCRCNPFVGGSCVQVHVSMEMH